MSFGSDMGKFLTSSEAFEAQLLIGDREPVAIPFDKRELESYIKDYQLIIRMGIEDAPGSKNELTLEAGQGPLKSGMTYVIGSGPQAFIKASFALKGYIEYFPSDDYSGSLTIKQLSTDSNGKTILSGLFSIYFKSNDEDVKVNCSAFQVSN